MKSFIRKFKLNTILFSLEILLVLVCLLLNFAVLVTGGHWAWQNMVSTDGATMVLTAISHNLNLGVPYKDYWEYRPPGFFLLIDLWVKLLGSKVLSFKLMESLFLFLVGLEICLLARKIFSLFQGFIISCLTIIVFFSPAFGSLGHAEIKGLFFSLLGLLCLLYIKRINLRFFLAAFFLAFSAQVKDSFFGTILAIIPSLLYIFALREYKSFFKGILFSFLGVFLSYFLIWIYLIDINALSAYLEVFRFKSNVFKIRIWEDPFFFLGQYYRALRNGKENLSYFNYHSVIILAIWVISIFISVLKTVGLTRIFKVTKKSLNLVVPAFRFTISQNTLNITTLVFYLFGSYIGPSLLNLFTAHYLLQLVVTTYFVWGLVAISFENNIRKLFKWVPKNIIFLLAVFFLLFPQKWISVQYKVIPKNVIQQVYNNILLPDADISFEKYVNSKTNNKDCILSLYGWKSSEAYLFSERKPCTRFIIPNIVNDQWQKNEYRESLLKNPPQAIVYSIEGADMDVALFEKDVINIPLILNKCYKQDFKYINNGRWPVQLYFPVFSGNELRNCISNNVI
jgi:hypothetical protein